MMMRTREGQLRITQHDDLYIASEINNLAATNIQNADYEQALSKLEYALKIVAKQMRLSSGKCESSLPCCHGWAPPGSEGRVSSIIPTMVLSLEKDEGRFVYEQSRATGIQQAPSESRFSLCRSPLRIQNGSELLPLPRSFEVFSYVILYNIALSWHLKSLDAAAKPDVRSLGLRKSLKLYEHANRIMTSGNLLQGNPLPYMALICNLGSLYMSVNDHGMAVKCQDHLLSSIMCWIDYNRRDHHEWDFLLDSFLASAMQQFFVPRTAPAA